MTELLPRQLELPVAERRQADVIRDLSDYGSPQVAPCTRPAPISRGLTRPLAQPDSRVLRRVAAARIRAVAVYREERAKLTPAQVADRRTSLMDARIALCVAQGDSLDDIDPTSGLSMSHSSYEDVRWSWISLIKFHGFNDDYNRKLLDEALAFWAERRPQYLHDDDWLAAGMAAHREYWQGIGHGCNAPYCEMHGESTESE